ncbi:MAG: 2-oxoacid:acceptor oxidoreductase family protein [Thermodesulfobacteriota bacterium]
MSKRFEARLSGEGGQGLILAGIILAEAAAMYDGKNAVQTQSYGPEARGGFSKSEVIISDEEIDYPKATKLDFLLALTQEACDNYSKDLKPDAILLADSTAVKRSPSGNFKFYSLPVLETASNEIGKAVVANIVALGATVGLTGIVSEQAIEKAVLSRVPRGTEELNRHALHVGLSMGKKLREE